MDFFGLLVSYDISIFKIEPTAASKRKMSADNNTFDML